MIEISNPQVKALQDEIGQRGQTPLNSYNRGPVRRWLVALGIDSPTARTLPNGELDRLYNDTSDQALLDLMGKPPSAPAPRPASHPVSVSTPDTAELAGQLAVILAGLQARPSMDEDRVREILAEALDALPVPTGPSEAEVQEMIRKAFEEQGPRVIEFRTPRGVTQVEGYTHEALPTLVGMLSAGCHVWLVGPAGSGKTTLAEQAAKALGLAFYSTGAVTSDFRLIGYQTATGELVRTPFRDAFERGGVFLWDEVDASNPNALVAFNQALANGHYAFPDGMVEKHPDFVAIAAANSWGHGATSEYVGRVRQDAATLDRFAFLPIGYDERLETRLAGDHADWARLVQATRRAASRLGIKAVISPRATILGSRLLSAGLDRQTVLQSTLRKAIDEPSWTKLVQDLPDLR